MTFAKIVHRHIDGTKHKIANAYSALEHAGWDHRDVLHKLLGELKTGNVAYVREELEKITKKKNKSDQELVDAARLALEILNAEVPDVVAYVYVCIEKDSVIHSIIEGTIETDNRRGEDRDDLSLNEKGEIADCVIIWRNGLVRHVDESAVNVLGSLMYDSIEINATPQPQGEPLGPGAIHKGKSREASMRK